jgi:hypothetical protein
MLKEARVLLYEQTVSLVYSSCIVSATLNVVEKPELLKHTDWWNLEDIGRCLETCDSGAWTQHMSGVKLVVRS